jgi:hypothetical protein
MLALVLTLLLLLLLLLQVSSHQFVKAREPTSKSSGVAMFHIPLIMLLY